MTQALKNTGAPTPEVRRMVTREMIEAHYKSVMNAARILLSQGETIHAQDLLSEACSRPYPSPAPASALLDSKNERIADLEAALKPFVKHNSSELNVTITVLSAAVTRARSLLAEGDTP